jgi:putative inorganic carbon (HCO3(-)) transporter
VHSNAFGFYLVLLVVVAVATIPHVDGRLRIGLGALVAVGSVELLLTYSRSSWLALVAGLVVVGCLQSRRLLVALLVSAAVVVIAVPSVSHRLTDLEAGRTDRGTAGNSLVWRFDYWRTSISLLHRNPVTGIGLKMTQFSTDAKRPPHNDFLRALVETGVVGFAAYLGFIWALCRTARRALRSPLEGAERGVAVGFAGIVAAFVLFSVGGNLLSQVVILWYLFALAAVAAALARPAEM